MTRTVFPFFTLLPLAAALTAAAQAAPVPQTGNVQSRISRVIAGPGDRPQGLFLRNGTFVSLSPELAQQLPATLRRNAPVRVTGDLLTYDGSRTIQAHTLQIAGVAYNQGPAAPPQSPAPRDPAAPPSPAPCAAGGPPPPPAAGPRVPPPSPDGAAPPPPPAPAAGTPPPPAPPSAVPNPPAPPPPAPAAPPAPQGS